MKQRNTFQSANAGQKEDVSSVRFPNFILNTVAITHTGCVRSANEDNYAMALEHDPATDQYHALFVVADGMGGHDFGEEASRAVCQAHMQTPQQDLAQIAKKAHTLVKGLEKPNYSSPGSTEVALRLAHDEKESHFHVGDSRIYRYNTARQTLEQLTEDDSVAWDHFRSGQLATKEDARRAPYKNIVTQCIGADGFDRTRTPTHPQKIAVGDVYLLCSDGLWDELSDAQIQYTLRSSYRAAPHDHRAAARALVNAALQAGGSDNITVILAGIDAAPNDTLESQFYAQGKEQFEKKLYGAAQQSFDFALLRNPRNSWAHYYLGRIHHELTDVESAKYHFASALRIRPAFATKDAEEARAFIAQNDYKRALWAVERAAIIAPYCSKTAGAQIAEAANKVGVAFKEGKNVSKDYTAAKRAFNSALAADASNADANYHMGTLTLMQKEYGLAGIHLRTVLQKEPNHRWAQYQLGRVYEAIGNKLAERHYQTAADLGLEQAAAALQKMKR